MLGGLSDKYGIDVSILRIVTVLIDFLGPDFLVGLMDIVKKILKIKNTVYVDKIKL